MNLTLCTCTLHSLVSNSNLNRRTIVVQKWMKLEHSRLKSIDKLPLSSLAYMFSRGCRPNLLAIIAVQKAQSIHRSITEARTNLCTQCPCNRKSMLRFYRCRRDWLNKSIQAEECGHALENCHLAFLAASVDLSFILLCQRRFNNFLFTRVNPLVFKPINLGFCPHTNPGLRAWKSADLPGFSGARVPGLHSLNYTSAEMSGLQDRSVQTSIRTKHFLGAEMSLQMVT